MSTNPIKFGELVIPLPAIPTSLSNPDQPEFLMHKVQRLLEKGKIREAQIEVRKLALIHFRESCSTVIKESAWMHTILTTIALSSDIGRDEFALDINDRFVINNDFGLERDCDCDGDPVQVLLFKEYGDAEEEQVFALMCKYPMTRPMPVLRQVPLPTPTFVGVNQSLRDEIMAMPVPDKDWEAGMTKVMSPQPVGIITTRYWSKILHDAVRLYSSRLS